MANFPRSEPTILVLVQEMITGLTANAATFPKVTDMQTIVADWRTNAEGHTDRNYRFLRSLKMKNGRAVDRAARG